MNAELRFDGLFGKLQQCMGKGIIPFFTYLFSIRKYV